MTILVTGATGGLGRNAVDFLAERGCAVRATGRDERAGRALALRGVPFVPLDLATASADEIDTLLTGVEAVWHCAALSAPWGPRAAFEAANVRATTMLAQTAATRRIRRFVHISTPSLYFDYTHRHAIDESYRPGRYVNHYAQTKALAEAALRELAARAPATTFVMLRPRAIFGPHDRVLLPRLLRVLTARRGRLPLPRGGAARIDLTYVENVVHAMWLATTRAVESGLAFNVTNGEPTTLRDMLDALFSRLSIPCTIVDVPYRALDAAARAMEALSCVTRREPMLTRYAAGALHYDMTLDIGRARTALGYHPSVPLARAIDQTANWIKRHGDDYGL
jgi:nucleoside-diphosphate-sugar epimerase